MAEASKKLLFVDDNRDIADSYSELLPEYGYLVDAANNSHEAFDLLKTNSYDIILLDMLLEETTGEKIYVEMLSNPAYSLNRDTPVAVFTGYPEEETRLRLHDLGVVAYLVKPFDPKALASVLDNLMETDRRRRETIRLSRQLGDLHRLNNLIFNSMPSGLIVVNSRNRIVLANRISHKILERVPGTLKDEDLQNVLGTDALKKIISYTDADLYGRPEAEVDLEDITITIGFTISTLTNRKGRKIGRVLVFQDITSIKAMAAESRRVERLASMGTLASGIAHEVKNPLAGIKAMAQNIEETLIDNPKMQQYAQRITGQVDRVNKLLSGFFSIVRQRKGERRIFPLDSVFRDVIPLLKGTADKKRLNIEVDETVDVEVFARPDQVQQVLLNLLLNAIDASPESSTIRIEVDNPITYPSRRPIFGAERAPDRLIVQPADSVAIRVVDNGPGIPEEQFQRIFDPFYTTKEQGTGLGLFIVHQLVQDELGGHIDVWSQPGETVFAIVLPTISVSSMSASPYDPVDNPGMIP